MEHGDEMIDITTRDYCPPHKAEFNDPGCPQCWHDERDSARERQARIDETARGLYVSWWRDASALQTEDGLTLWSDTAYRFALALESARTRSLDRAKGEAK